MKLQYFIDEKYFPNKLVFRKVFAALQSGYELNDNKSSRKPREDFIISYKENYCYLEGNFVITIISFAAMLGYLFEKSIANSCNFSNTM